MDKYVIMDDRITYDDVLEYQHLFKLVPSFVLERMAKKNSNLVRKFKSSVQSHIDDLTDDQRNKLDIILASSVNELQSIMHEAYMKTNRKQYEILANPKYRSFVESNIDELKKML